MRILNLKLNQRELDVGPTESVALRRDDNIALEVAPADWALEAGYPALGHPRALDSRVLHARDRGEGLGEARAADEVDARELARATRRRLLLQTDGAVLHWCSTVQAEPGYEIGLT